MKKNEVNKKQNKFSVANFFKFEQKKATWKKEILGGFTSFLALIYMINVEKSFLVSAGITNGAFMITCLVLGLGTIVMGLSTNTPVLATPAMGLNAMFAYNISQQIAKNTTPEAGAVGAMLVVMISTILILIVCYTKLLQFILKAIPQSLSIGITVAFGFYIAYVGLNSIGWFDQVGEMPVAGHGGLKTHYPGIILGMAVVVFIFLFHFKKVPGGVAISMIAGLIIAIILENTIKNSSSIANSFSDAKWDGWKYSVSDFDFTKIYTETFKNGIKESGIFTNATFYISIFLTALITLFNISASAYVIILDDIAPVGTEQFDLEVKKQLRTIAVIGAAGSVIGCSAIVTALETKAGQGQGAKTGFAAIFTGLCFLASLALLPIFKMMPSCITGAASIYIAYLMMSNITNVDWKQPEFLIAVGFMIVFSIVTFSITDGIAIGFIMYTLVCLFTKKARQISVTMWILSVIFVAYFIATAFTL